METGGKRLWNLQEGGTVTGWWGDDHTDSLVPWKRGNSELCDPAEGTARPRAGGAPGLVQLPTVKGEWEDKLKSKQLTIKATGPAECKNKMVSHSQMANKGFWIWFQ